MNGRNPDDAVAWLVEDRVAFIHELANPLSVLAIQVGLLETVDGDDPRLAAIRDGMKAQVAVLRALLRHADPRMAGVAPVEPRPLADLVNEVRRAHAGWAGVRGVAMPRPNGPRVQVQGDTTGLKVVLSNLVSNEVKAAAPGTDLVIGWSRHGDGVDLWVKSMARPVAGRSAGNQRPRAAAALVLDVGGPDGHGRGVGLAISERILHGMGGHLRFHKTPSGRLLANVYLPRGVVA